MYFSGLKFQHFQIELPITQFDFSVIHRTLSIGWSHTE